MERMYRLLNRDTVLHIYVNTCVFNVCIVEYVVIEWINVTS